MVIVGRGPRCPTTRADGLPTVNNLHHSHPSRDARRFAQLHLDNARLRALALCDDLTGLANRRAFLARLDEEVRRARRRGISFSILLLDLDGLKDINDTFGHQSGDAAIRAFGRRLVGMACAGDLVARIGGDEFALILRHGHAANPASIAARIAAVASPSEHADPYSGHTIALSAAVGLAAWDQDCRDAEDLLARADLSLYAAKSAAMHAPRATGSYLPRGRRTAAAEVRSLLAMARDVAAAASSTEMLRRAAGEAARLLDAEYATAALTGADGRIHFDMRWREDVWTAWCARVAPEETIIGRVVRDGAAQVMNRDDGGENVFLDPGVQAAIAVPIRGPADAVIGVLAVGNRRGRRPFGEHDVSIAQAFADLAATVVERSRAYAALETARDHLRSLMDNASDAILVIDPAGVGRRGIIDANRAAEQLLGYSRAELLGLTSLELRAPESQPGPSLGEMALSARGPVKAQRRYRRKDGSVVAVEGSATLVDSPLGPVVFLIVRDMTERAREEPERVALLGAV